MDQRRWSNLVPDVLREISSRVCAPTDFVYFHAACKLWRNSHDPLSQKTATTRFLPWLLAAAGKNSTHLRFRCIFSKSTYSVMSPTPPSAVQNWVSTADGTKVRYLTVERLRPTLHDPFTGEFTHLPDFPDDVSWWEKEDPGGIIYDDNTTFLYSLRYTDNINTRFRAALLRPGDTEWTVVERILVAPREFCEFCVAYHGGKIMVTVEATLWRVITPESGRNVGGDLLVPLPSSMLCEWKYYTHHYSFILESHGELLWASVQVQVHYNRNQREGDRLEYVLSFSVQALEEETRWVKKDGRCLADRVLFLGTPNSFAVDASRLSGQDGGCAYFVRYNFENLPSRKVGVWRCNLISNKAEFVDRLPPGWNDGTCTSWHVPQQPSIAPIQELMKAREFKQNGLVIRN